jgi:hypothetical protein
MIGFRGSEIEMEILRTSSASVFSRSQGQKPTFIQINSGMRLQNQEFDNLSAVCHEHEIDQLNGMF